ncbi:MAG: bifunctional phosphoglucose/phosphomannose isomerase [Candidatus Woesearchaeota archaeon]|jgi:glucose/mannose-6-phosphate isomerase|nr:bifunctional phosphoglucose/phosphomannose isomerase [Candidatus Woesearchaeota archaeon]MDP7324404.1 bifunctional phosphoglucose/phosphomannose isomerase [Candidatus Woesearchaeota archaeon]
MEEKEIKEIDKEDMYQVLKDFPLQIQKGWNLAKDVSAKDEFDKVMVSGMGGSCLPGEILKSYLDDFSMPIILNKDYSLPAFTNEKTLLFLISYSGNTEETINAFREAQKKLAKIIVISSGGKLKKLAEEQQITYVEVPEGLQPRFSYGYMFLVVLRILQNCNVIENQDKAVEKTVETLRKDIFKESAEELSEKLVDKIPVIYSSANLRAVSYKWKINFNENSKIPAFSNVFPELNHNEMNGYVHVSGSYHVIIIKDDSDYVRTRKRMDIFKELVKQRGVEVTEIGLSGPNKLAKLISAIYIGDWVSFFLAMKRKEDPTPVKLIEEFKEKLVK